jgi:hypothetical protein
MLSSVDGLVVVRREFHDHRAVAAVRIFIIQTISLRINHTPCSSLIESPVLKKNILHFYAGYITDTPSTPLYS